MGLKEEKLAKAINAYSAIKKIKPQTVTFYAVRNNRLYDKLISPKGSCTVRIYNQVADYLRERGVDVDKIT